MPMGIELKEELLKVQRVIGEQTAPSIIREILTLPAEGPAIQQVLRVDTVVKTTSFEIIKDKVVVEGTIDAQVLFVAQVPAGTQPVQHFQSELSFDVVVEVPGTLPDMNAFVRAEVRNVNFAIRDSRVVEVTIALDVFAKVTQAEQESVVIEVTGPEDIKVAKELLKVEEVVGEALSQLVVTERLTVPEEKPGIAKVISVDARPRLTDVQVLDGRVLVQGIIDVNVLYAAQIIEPYVPVTRLPVHFAEFEVRFSQFVEIPAAIAGMNVFVDVFRESVDFDLLDSRTISVDVVLRIFTKVTATRQLEVVTEVTSTTLVLDVQKKLLKVEDVIGEDIAQTILKETLKVPREKPNIDRIISIEDTVRTTEVKVLKDRVIIEGTVALHVLYVANTPEGDQPVHHMEATLKFTQAVSIPGAEPDMNAEVRSRVEHVDFEVLDDRTFVVKVLIGVFVKVTEPLQLRVVVNVVVVTAPEVPCPTPTLIYVQVQPGDTLWALARKYNTTVQAIVEANKLENPDVIFVGQMLLIPSCPPPKG